MRGRPPDRGVYVEGSVGRMGFWVHGTDSRCDEVSVPAGSLWRVDGSMAPFFEGDHCRYTLVLLDEVRQEDPRGISYDGAGYGFLDLEPAREYDPEYYEVHFGDDE